MPLSSSEEDPFAMFDGDDDDDDNGDKNNDNVSSTLRPASHGPLSHFVGIEQAMVQHVMRNITSHPSCASNNNDDDDTSRPSATSSTINPSSRRVLQAIDDFCYQRHWMMHLGPEKGATLRRFLESTVITRQQSLLADNDDTLVVLELGTYCGYSAVYMCHVLHDLLSSSSSPGNHRRQMHKFRVVTVDVDATYQKVARQVVDMAGWSHQVDFVLLPTTSNCDDNALVASLQPKLQKHAHFVLLDHDKDRYLSDLQALERARIVRKHTAVAADNVVVFGLDNYRSHVQGLARLGVVTTALHAGHLEYVTTAAERAQFPDGMECTVYVKDPPSVISR